MFEPMDYARLDEGLQLLGWRADTRLTSEDEAMIWPVAEEALRLETAGKLGSPDIEKLALDAYDVMSFQIMNIEERTLMITELYSESKHLKAFVPLVDEATLCFYRGYTTAALATLFIVLEGHLRSLIGWQPGDRRPSFAELRAAPSKLPESESREEAAAILNVVYQHYDAAQPPVFYYNRHGLLHGLRSGLKVDKMNTVRLFLLLDVLCFADGLTRSTVWTEEFRSAFNNRKGIYGNCVDLGEERILLEKHA